MNWPLFEFTAITPVTEVPAGSSGGHDAISAPGLDEIARIGPVAQIQRVGVAVLHSQPTDR